MQSTGGAGAALNYDPILDAAFTVLGGNVPPENLKVIMNARSAKSLAKLKNAGLDYLVPPAAFTNWGQPLLTNAIPNNLVTGASTDTSEIYIGDFSELLIGIRTSFKLEVSRQAEDATSSAFSNLQVWVRAYLRADIQIGHPEAFVVILGVRP
jgi:HK97 family phage major capsid protein